MDNNEKINPLWRFRQHNTLKKMALELDLHANTLYKVSKSDPEALMNMKLGTILRVCEFMDVDLVDFCSDKYKLVLKNNNQ